MASINIPSTIDDPNYRYKMPRVKAKIEGRGNGIKTNITNMAEISRALKRSPEYSTKFCGFELGSQSKFDGAEGKAIVNGAHTEEVIQVIVDKFIDRFVLCPNCRLPEADLKVAKQRVRGKCNACGFSGDLDNAHKLVGYILKNPPVSGDSTMGKKTKDKESKSRSERQRSKVKKETAEAGDLGNADSQGLDDDNTPPTEEKKDKKDKKEKKEKKVKKEKTDKKVKKEKTETVEHNNEDLVLTYDSEEIQRVIVRLDNFLTKGERPTPQEFFQEVRLLQVAQDFDSILRVYVAFASLFSSKSMTKAEFANVLPYIKAVCDRSIDGQTILSAFDLLLTHRLSPEASSEYALICKELYDHDLVEESDFLKCYSDQAIKASPTRSLAAEKAKPFLAWLDQAESASDDDDEDDNDEDENDDKPPSSGSSASHSDI